MDTWLMRRLNLAFMEPRSYVELGWIRLCVYLTALLLSFTLLGHFSLWADVHPVFWQPVAAFEVFRLGPLGPEALSGLLWLFRVLLLVAAFGLGGKPTRLVVAALSVYVFGLPHNFGKVDHGDAVLVFCLFILALSNADEGFSVRSLWRSTRDDSTRSRLLTPEARWPVTLMQLTLAIALAAAGFAKLRTSGLDWITTDNLRFVIERHAFTHRPLLNLTALFEFVPWLPKVFGAGTILFELLAPLLIVLRGRAKAILMLGVLGMLAGFSAGLGIWALQFDILVLVLFLPWRSILAFSLRMRRTLPRFTLLYDGSCGICTKTMRLIRRVDILGRIEIVDLVGQWHSVSTRFPFVSLDLALTDMHAVRRGETFPTMGFEAYRSFARSVPLFWPVWLVSHLPIVSHIGRRIYRRVADHRHEGGCELPTEMRA